MNILPHKSWHVYNQANRERVRKDEAEAKEHEKKNLERANKAESEYRLSELRRKAKSRLSNSTDTKHSEQDEQKEHHSYHSHTQDNKRKHTSLWSEPDLQDKNDRSSKRKQTNNDVKAGTPLVGIDKASWYLDPRHKEKREKTDGSKSKSSSSKDRDDPLNVMNDMIGKKKSFRENQEQSTEKPRDQTTLPSSSEPKPLSTIERLRKERLERENAEKIRARSKLDPYYVDPKDRQSNPSGYNQQFNPEETRKAHQPHSSHGSSSRRDSRGTGRYSSFDETQSRGEISKRRRHY